MSPLFIWHRHGRSHRIVLLTGLIRHVHLDPATLRRELDRIAHQVHENAAHLFPIAFDEGHVGCHARGKRDATLERHRLVGCLHHAYDVVEVDKLQVKALRTRLNASRLEHVVHHFEKDAAILLDFFHLP